RASSVHRSSCIASNVRTMCTLPPVCSSSTAVSTSYGSTPGMKSASSIKTRRRGGSTCVYRTRWWLVSGMPACFMYSTWSAPTALIAYRSSPPGRRSSALTVTLNPSGPHHDSIPSFVVHSSHTSAAEAGYMRSRVSLGRLDARAAVRLLELGDVELLHLEHRRHRCLRVARLLVAEHLRQLLGHDLPREPEAILQPSARAFLAAIRGQLGPVAVNLFLRLAHDHQRIAFGESEGGSTVEGEELPPV